MFTEKGDLIPVTLLEAGPCFVTQKKTVDKEGYDAIQVGFHEENKQNRINQAKKGHFEKSGVKPTRFLKELRLEDVNGYEVGAEIKADVFAIGERVDITGTSKGKGYQGAIKRHNQHRGPMTHGSKYHRGLGSMGPATTPGKVRKGKKMAGHMGDEQITIQNLEVVKIDLDKNLIAVKGAVPGIKGALLYIKDSVKA